MSGRDACLMESFGEGRPGGSTKLSLWHLALSSIVKSILTAILSRLTSTNGGHHTQVPSSSPVFWATIILRISRASKAIVNRLIVIKCPCRFDTQNLSVPPRRHGGAATRPVLNGPARNAVAVDWLIAGLRRVLERGYSAITPEMVRPWGRCGQDSTSSRLFIDECTDLPLTPWYGPRLLRRVCRLGGARTRAWIGIFAFPTFSRKSHDGAG